MIYKIIGGVWEKNKAPQGLPLPHPASLRPSLALSKLSLPAVCWPWIRSYQQPRRGAFPTIFFWDQLHSSLDSFFCQSLQNCWNIFSAGQNPDSSILTLDIRLYWTWPLVSTFHISDKRPDITMLLIVVTNNNNEWHWTAFAILTYNV